MTDTSFLPLVYSSPTPPSLQGKDWSKHAKKAQFTFDGQTLSFQAGSSKVDWSAVVGSAPGQVAACLHVSGRFGMGGAPLLLDHLVFTDSTGAQVGQALRRSVEGLDPSAAFWPIDGPEGMRAFLVDLGVPLKYKVFGSAAELEAAFPGLPSQCPTLRTPRKRFGLWPSR